MITCRYCRKQFRKTPEELGARCPRCSMPLFERPQRRGTRVDLGFCAVHPQSNAVATCRRCSAPICSVCRTRWDDSPICTTCFSQLIDRAEPPPREQRARDRRAYLGLFFALLGWGILLLELWPLSAVWKENLPTDATWMVALFILSFVPALLGIGQTAEVLRRRGRRLALATVALCLAGVQLGLMFGILFVNIWNN